MGYPLQCDECRKEIERETYIYNSGLCMGCYELLIEPVNKKTNTIKE